MFLEYMYDQSSFCGKRKYYVSDCNNNFQVIDELKQHDKIYTFNCHGCGDCLKKKVKLKLLVLF